MRRFRYNAVILFMFSLLMMTTILPLSVQAGELTLNNNSGDTSSAFFIDGEPTLVMNGFDLTPRNVALPATLDVVTLAVQEVVPGAPVQLVIYEDSNGGDPVDAQLVYRSEISINQPGTAFITLPEPVTVNSSVIWVGYYLPVGFRFFGDDSGSSVLTYWGWSPATTFDLADLSSAQVFGPADGSDPVGIDMGGVARITAEITPSPSSGGFTGTGENDEGVPIGVQIEGGNVDLSVMDLYPYCGERLLYDPQDIEFTARLRFTTHCRADLGSFSPGLVQNEGDLPANVSSYERRGFFYEVFVNGETAPDSAEKLLIPVTHCLRPEQGELDTAVVAIAYGAPRAWEFLPTARYGEWVCAEVTHQGFISYFVPRTGDESYENVDLSFGGVPRLVPAVAASDRGLLCNFRYTVNVDVRNEGFEPAENAILRVQMVSVRTNTISRSVDYNLGTIANDETASYEFFDFLAPETFVNEEHYLRYILDPGEAIPELNEANNVIEERVLVLRTNRCN